MPSADGQRAIIPISGQQDSPHFIYVIALRHEREAHMLQWSGLRHQVAREVESSCVSLSPGEQGVRHELWLQA